MRILLASNNKKKLAELKSILGDEFDVLSLSEAGVDSEPEETGNTFEENAEIKAVSACKASGLPSIADDSGLSVDVLDGAPGVYSARYGGEDTNDQKNNELLLKNLENKDNRKARFVSAICFYLPNGEKFFSRGECEGIILKSPQGENGFGYDPLFYVEEYKKTFAELDSEQKNKISHRGRALEKIVPVIKEKINDK
ncbi:MAG: non-canonical purine NTP pyrophosphatase [Clostridiales bacterium]|nr:MAG: non-canonical purine NTP pyrophosphatase [Clostridiales bacterium]